MFLHDLGYTTGQFGKNHPGDHTDALPTAHGFQEYWGYLYHLDAIGGAIVSPSTAYIYDWNLLSIGQHFGVVRDTEGVSTVTGAGELQPHAGDGTA